MACIQAAHYAETEERLTKDPIVRDMADNISLEELTEFIHEGEPSFEFMTRANCAYRDFGGEDGGHIGAIANAILKIKGLG